MKIVRTVLLAALLAGVAAVPANAAVLTFDDIAADSIGYIPDGYGGFDWTNMAYIQGSAVYPTSGYENGAVSGTYVAFNDSEFIASAAATSFNFYSAYLTAAWRNGLSIEVQGFLGATMLYNQTVVVNPNSPTLFNFNYFGIDRLQLRGIGGTYAGFGWDGTHFAMDNFDAAGVPEPMSLLLLGSGLAGLAVRRRRSRG
jgi:hypothetical protein